MAEELTEFMKNQFEGLSLHICSVKHPPVPYDDNYVFDIQAYIVNLEKLDQLSCQTTFDLLIHALRNPESINYIHLIKLCMKAIFEGPRDKTGAIYNLNRDKFPFKEKIENLDIKFSELFHGRLFDRELNEMIVAPAAIRYSNVHTPTVIRCMSATVALLILRLRSKSAQSSIVRYRNVCEKLLKNSFGAPFLPSGGLNWKFLAKFLSKYTDVNEYYQACISFFVLAKEEEKTPYLELIEYCLLDCLEYQGLQTYTSSKQVLKALNLNDLSKLKGTLFGKFFYSYIDDLDEFYKKYDQSKNERWKYCRAFHNLYFSEMGFSANTSTKELILHFHYVHQLITGEQTYDNVIQFRKTTSRPVEPLREILRKNSERFVDAFKKGILPLDDKIN